MEPEPAHGATPPAAPADARWTDPTRRLLLAAAGRFADAVIAHAQVLASARNQDDLADAAEVAQQLSRAGADYFQAQEDYAGEEVLELLLDEDEDDIDEVQDGEAPGGGGAEMVPLLVTTTPAPPLPPASGAISLLQRVDLVVLNPDAVLEAALDVDVPPDRPDLEDNSFGSALLLLLEDGGTRAVVECPGLAATGATTVVVEQDAVLDDSAPWPEDPFAGDWPALCRLDEVRTEDA